MKILCFSDWRKPPMHILESVVQETKLDLILYGGDDTERFVPKRPESTPAITRLIYPRFDEEWEEESLERSRWFDFPLESDPRDLVAKLEKALGRPTVRKPLFNEGTWTARRVLALFAPLEPNLLSQLVRRPPKRGHSLL